MRFAPAKAGAPHHPRESPVLLTCLCAVHLPLLTLVLVQAITGQWQASTLLAVLTASLVAATLCLRTVRALLAADEAPIVSGARMSPGDERFVLPSERDALTGLPSRHAFLDSSERLLARGCNSVIALVDIDHFQSVNDRFGRPAGDALLRAVGHRLERGLRRDDLASRWAGEAFAVLLPDTQLDEARLVMERLRASVALDPLLGTESTGNLWPVTLSCGLAPVRDFGKLGEATHRAHAALNAAKNGGRNRVRIARND